jgi:hypothetical protein
MPRLWLKNSAQILLKGDFELRKINKNAGRKIASDLRELVGRGGWI